MSFDPVRSGSLANDAARTDELAAEFVNKSVKTEVLNSLFDLRSFDLKIQSETKRLIDF